MSYIGSKEESYNFIDMRLHNILQQQTHLALEEHKKGNVDISNIYAKVAQCCLEQLQEVQKMRENDNHEIHYSYIDEVFKNQKQK
jgi:hypothetical protein